jgi:hypothetical protein
MYRQGDVLIVRADSIPKDAKVVARNHLVLALGEATGHSHTITLEGAELLTTTLERWMTLPSETEIVHQEHAPIQIPAGDYQVIQQVEYTPTEIRNVHD